MEFFVNGSKNQTENNKPIFANLILIKKRNDILNKYLYLIKKQLSHDYSSDSSKFLYASKLSKLSEVSEISEASDEAENSKYSDRSHLFEVL